MVSLLAGLQSISKELYEAAYVDGADSFRTFLHITIPQLRPILLSIGLLDMIWTLNLFPLIWLLTGGGPNGATETIAIFTYKLAFNEFQFGQASAMAVIGVAVTMVITLFYLKYQQSV
jgi:multiple sugar transport system permease protein